MATYDYKCMKCESICELQYPMDSPPTAVLSCECGGTLRKQFTPPGIVFKGTGFYRTDRKK